MSHVKPVGVGVGGDVISFRRVTSTVRGEKVQLGSNNNTKKKKTFHMEGRHVFIQITIGQQWNQPRVAPQFSGTKRSFLAVFPFMDNVT